MCTNVNSTRFSLSTIVSRQPPVVPVNRQLRQCFFSMVGTNTIRLDSLLVIASPIVFEKAGNLESAPSCYTSLKHTFLHLPL